LYVTTIICRLAKEVVAAVSDVFSIPGDRLARLATTAQQDKKAKQTTKCDLPALLAHVLFSGIPGFGPGDLSCPTSEKGIPGVQFGVLVKESIDPGLAFALGTTPG
jgi:hypothetical protein